jgi:hypothetical protein
MGHKEGGGEVREDTQLTSIEVMLINCRANQNVPHHSPEGCLAIFSQYSVQLMTKLQAYVFVPINQSMHSSQSVKKILVTMQDVLYAHVRYAYHLSKHTRRLSWTEADGRQHLGNVLGCANRGRLTMKLLHATNLLHTMALPINGLHLEMGLPADSVHGEICAEYL